MMRTKEMQRWQALHRTRNQGGMELWRQVKEALLHTGYFAADHCRHLIILSVFAFKVSILTACLLQAKHLHNNQKSLLFVTQAHSVALISFHIRALISIIHTCQFSCLWKY